MALSQKQIKEIERLANKLKKWSEGLSYDYSPTLIRVLPDLGQDTVILALLKEMPAVGQRLQRDFDTVDAFVGDVNKWCAKGISTNEESLEHTNTVQVLKEAALGLATTLCQIADMAMMESPVEPSVSSEQTPPETHITTVGGDRRIELIDDFCNWTDKLINYIKHPDRSREVSKARADALGDQVNNLAQKIWPQLNFDETGMPYESSDIPECANLCEGSIFSIEPKLRERIIERLQQWKGRALKDKSELQEELRLQARQGTNEIGSSEALLEAKPPESLQKLLWIWKHGRRHWKLILSAIAIFLIWSILAKFDLMSRFYTLIKDMCS